MKDEQLAEWKAKDIATLEKDYAVELQKNKDLKNQMDEKDAEIRMLKKTEKQKSRGQGTPVAAAAEEPHNNDDDDDDAGGRGGGRKKRRAPSSSQPGSKASQKNKKRK